VRDEGLDSGVIEAAVQWFHDVDARFSTYRADSEISRLGRGELAVEDCSEDVRDVLRRCEAARVRSNGCFDIRYGDELDPSGLVKGWSVDRAASMLEAAGARNFFINAGGDVIARGAPTPGRRWRLGIRHPEHADRVAAVLAISDLAVATSGLYERGDHVIDPRTRLAPSGVVSVTVAGPSLTDADAYATAAFVMGELGATWVAAIDGYDVLSITDDNRVLSSAGMDALRAPFTE
jgi:thiamine biosynthesis lipoprotein